MSKKKLLFIVTEDWYFVSHRLALAEAAIEDGFDVVVATKITECADEIRSARIGIVPFVLSRRFGNPFAEIYALTGLFRREKPDIVHNVALKPVIYSSIAARLARLRCWVNAVAGLGWFRRENHLRSNLTRALSGAILAWVLNHSRSLTIVQNPDDAKELLKLGVQPDRLVEIRGAGVNLEQYKPTISPVGEPVVITLVSRMLRDKGIEEFVRAAEIIQSKGIDAKFILAGEPDASNSNSVREDFLKSWNGRFSIEWVGRCDDVAALYGQSHIACLPSYYGEGIPKSLIEAAACGLPIVTTDMPGCKEAVHHGINGLLVPPRDATSLSDALIKLIEDSTLRQKMGIESRKRAQAEFGESAIIKQTISVYHSALELRDSGDVD